jgi:hypothetical protein
MSSEGAGSSKENEIDDKYATDKETKYIAPVRFVETVYPLSTPGGTLPPEILKAFAKVEPSEVLKFVENYHQRELDLKTKTLDYQNQLAFRQEENRAEMESDSRKIIRFSIGSFCIIFVGVLGYSILTGDKTLPNQIITLVSGALAGGGGLVLFQGKNQKRKKEDDYSKE